MKTPLQFAIIGCGRIAKRHAKYIDHFGELVAVCDIEPNRARQLAEQYDVPAYTDYNDLLEQEDMDVVSVCTPNSLHPEHAIAALQAGAHVLCEKPMAISVADCGNMIQAAERANRRLFVVKQNRFNPPVAAVKECIAKGQLGRIFSVQLNCFWNRNEAYYKDSSWKGDRSIDGGCLYTQFSHFIDLLYWLIGDVDTVHGLVENYNHQETVDFEDTGVVTLRFRNGAMGTIHFTTNSYGGNMEGSLTIFAEKGTVKIGGQYLNELEYQNIEDYEIEGLPPGNPPNQYGHYEGSMSNHDKVYENLVEVLTREGVIATNAYEGLKTVEIIEKIYAAAHQAAQREVDRYPGRAVRQRHIGY